MSEGSFFGRRERRSEAERERESSEGNADRDYSLNQNISGLLETLKFYCS